MRTSNAVEMAIPVFVISLQTDAGRRANLRRSFGATYDTFSIVNAVDLRGRYRQPDRFRPRAWCDPDQRALTEAQVACALSHVRALEEFMDTTFQRCIVFEDDVIGDEKSLRSVTELLVRLPQDAFVLLGGQQGLKGRHYLIGTKVPDANAWRLPGIARQFTARAVAYSVCRQAARLILRRQRAHLDHPDHWSALLRGYRQFFYTEIFEHPVDLKASHMEAERKLVNASPLYIKILRDGVVESSCRAVSKILVRIAPRILNYAVIPAEPDGSSSRS